MGEGNFLTSRYLTDDPSWFGGGTTASTFQNRVGRFFSDRNRLQKVAGLGSVDPFTFRSAIYLQLLILTIELELHDPLNNVLYFLWGYRLCNFIISVTFLLS